MHNARGDGTFKCPGPDKLELEIVVIFRGRMLGSTVSTSTIAGRSWKLYNGYNVA
ncbi:hypothetical protein PIIN_09897 [Serendipita indica DSM 11827]|uniref:Uncharacterized protein n=1 Tax=Serendipita indica (strain DSM 11827) TaxID=1109443 RepID=G4TX58_SERID|nr:hypothetical protein PIIN_09897 [Serendipita indica DSM 11827]